MTEQTPSVQPDYHGMSELAAQWRTGCGDAENWPGLSTDLNPSDYRTINSTKSLAAGV